MHELNSFRLVLSTCFIGVVLSRTGPICYYQPDSGHLSHPFELPFGGLGVAVVMDTDD